MFHVPTGNVDDVFTVLLPYWPLPESEISVLRMQTVQQRGMVSERFGQTLDIRLVDEKLVADSILRITYMEKFERHIIRWVFTYYKPRDQWIVNSIEWDDNIDALL